MNWTPVAFAGYVVAGFLTFGHVFNANYVEPTPVKDCGAMPETLSETWDDYWDCRQYNIGAKYSGTSYFEAAFPAVYAAVVWPIYWGGKAAIRVTK